MSVLEFTDAERRRPHLYTEAAELGGTRVWDAASMQWDVFSAEGRHIGIICPDHVRAEGTPEYEALRAAVALLLASNNGRKRGQS